MERLPDLLTWEGKQGPALKTVKALTEDQQARFERGKDLYAVTCGACHQPGGEGQDGLAPPLADSEWTTGSEERLIRIALQGMRGPVTVKGKTYELEMPGMGILDDEELASILTYTRRAWGHTADPIEPATVARIRTSTESREEAWTESELLKLQ
jgi:mono/diheme cytochrome c family protein